MFYQTTAAPGKALCFCGLRFCFAASAFGFFDETDGWAKKAAWGAAACRASHGPHGSAVGRSRRLRRRPHRRLFGFPCVHFTLCRRLRRRPHRRYYKKSPFGRKKQAGFCSVLHYSSAQRIILRRLCAVFSIYAPNSVHHTQTPNFISIMRLQMKTASFIMEGKPAKEESLQSKTTDRSENIRCLLNDGRQTALHGKILNVKTAKTKNSIPNAV